MNVYELAFVKLTHAVYQPTYVDEYALLMQFFMKHCDVLV